MAKLSASVDGRDPLGRTPLHWACYRSQASTADFLLSRGADPEARASPRVDRLWVAGLWDTRARSMAEGGLGAVVLLEGAEEELGPTALDVVQRQHAARVIAKSKRPPPCPCLPVCPCLHAFVPLCFPASLSPCLHPCLPSPHAPMHAFNPKSCPLNPES